MENMGEFEYKGKDLKAQELLLVFEQRGYTFAAAESCTGGLVNARLTAVPGSSCVVQGGVVSYSNLVKEKVLSVKADTLFTYGAVSEETAYEMAEGVRLLCGADIAVSLTGIAGPGGGTEKKPVGTVCFGLSTKRGTRTQTVHFGSDLSRDEIRRKASDHAITLAVSAAKEGAI